MTRVTSHRKALTLIVAGLVAAPLLLSSPGVATSAPVVAAPHVSATGDGTRVPAGSVPSRTITLITGDVVRVVGRPGRESAQVVVDTWPKGDVTMARMGEDLYAIPGTAVRMLARDELDLQLFNLSLLVRDGYADKDDTSLPVIVTYESDVAARQAQQDADLAGATVDRRLRSVNGLAAGVSDATASRFFDAVTARARTRTPQDGPTARPLVAEQEVDKIWLDGPVRASLDVSRVTVGANRAEAAGFDGTGVKVAVLDTGIDEAHPDLVGQVVEGRRFGEGNPDDFHDGHGHGTHVASIVAGTGAASNGTYRGVAPGTDLVIGKVLDDAGVGQWSDVIAGMEWAADRAPVINMSLGGSPTDGTDPVSQALNEISRRTGALFVVSAGNEGADLTVTNPASSDEALAVSAVSRDGQQLGGFSSTGPRQGDWALKPEIAAPGVRITAARAGTDGYVAYNGTSMAAPHVAGAAAIVAHRHPDWSARQLRDALTSTARPAPRLPIWWQGAGVVDAGTAVTQDLFGTGILNLGVDAYPQQPGDTLSGTITYTNDADAPINLDLTSTWTNARRHHQYPAVEWTPPDGAVVIQPASLTVPAGGTATATVTVDTGQAPYNATYGRVVAAATDGTSVHTTVQFVRDVERHQLSLPAIDRTGSPAHTTSWSFGFLTDLETRELTTAHKVVVWDQGDSVIYDDGRPGLPEGRYSFTGWIVDFGPAPWYPVKSYTFVAEPEIVLDRDREFVLDAREAGPVRELTQRPTASRTGTDLITRTRPAPGNDLLLWPETPDGNVHGTGTFDRYLLRSETSATSGTFHYQRTTTRVAPPITLDVGGRRIVADYPFEGVGVLCTQAYGRDCVPRFPKRERTTLVDVGTATPQEIEHADLDGRYALVRPPALPDDPSPEDIGAVIEWLTDVDRMARRVRDAGGTGVVLIPPADGFDAVYCDRLPWDDPSGCFQQAPSGAPVAVLPSVADGDRLATLAESGPVRLGLRGTFPSPYAYNLQVRRDGRLTNGIDYRPRDRELARVDARYHGDTEGEWWTLRRPDFKYVGYPYFPPEPWPDRVPGRFKRTEYYTPGVEWQLLAAVNSDSMLTEFDSRRVYAAGSRVRQDFGAGPWVPGEYRGDYRLEVGVSHIPGFMYGRGESLTVDLGLFNGPGERHNDELQMSGMSAVTGDTLCVAGCAQNYSHEVQRLNAIVSDDTVQVVNETTLHHDTQIWGPPALSTHTRTEWTVHTDLHPTERREQPGVLLDWRVESGLDNVVSRDGYELTVTPGYSSRYAGDHGPFLVELWVTYDDGETWVKVGRRSGIDKGRAARFAVDTPRPTNGFVGYRAIATDRAGNAVDQTVLRAARTRPAASG